MNACRFSLLVLPLLTTPLAAQKDGADMPQSSQDKRAAQLFERMDADRDGRLAKNELPIKLQPNFERVDTDKDGFISPSEHLSVLKTRQDSARNGETGNPAPRRPAPAGVEVAYDLPYADTDNPRQTLDLYLPNAKKTEAPLPVIVFIHGGGWRNGDKSSGAGQVGRYVASGQYAAVSVGYRLSGEATWPAQIHDCKAAVRWIKGNAEKYGLDADKIGVWGTSAGGHLVSMLGTSGDVKELEGSLGKHLDQNSQVTCVVNFFGPENFLTMVRQPSTINRTQGGQYPEALLLGGPVDERQSAAREASPVTHASAGDPPFFTAHGTEDPVVPYVQALEIHEVLQKAGVPSLLQEMTGGGHGFRSEQLESRVQQFFDLHLRGVAAEIESTPIQAAQVRK